ncbi:MAG: carbohydrate kinase [Kiritimatiellae bacterium]|nr:carbohydrate kinase [Kiritimatiellia bacterium]
MDNKTPSLLIAGLGEVLWDMLPDGRQCGGAPANVIYHASKLGAQGLVVSAVGADADGNDLLAFLEGKGIDCSLVARNDLPTGTVTVTLENGMPSYVIHHPAAWDAIPYTDAIDAVVPRLSAVVFGSLAQRDGRSRETLFRVLRHPSLHALKFFDINLRQNFYSREIIAESLEVADVLKLNDEECDVLAELFDLPHDQRGAVAALAERFKLSHVILTLGAKGSMLYDGAAFAEYPVAPCEKLVDTVGCGDAFLAAWCVAFLAGKGADAAMREATELSAYVAGHKGAMC